MIRKQYLKPTRHTNYFSFNVDILAPALSTSTMIKVLESSTQNSTVKKRTYLKVIKISRLALT